MCHINARRQGEVIFKTRTAVLSSLKIRGRSPRIFRLDKTRAVSVLNSFKNDPLLVVLYKILCSLVFFLMFYQV